MEEGIPACALEIMPETRTSAAVKFRAHRVPNLQLDLFAVNVYHTSPKLHTNGQVMDRLKPLVRELQKKAGLADSCASKALILVRCRSLRRR